MNQDTICAIATANGVGALGIIRLSGSDAVKIAQSAFKGTDLEKVESHTVHYGYIVEKSQEARTGNQEQSIKRKEERRESQDGWSEDEELRAESLGESEVSSAFDAELEDSGLAELYAEINSDNSSSAIGHPSSNIQHQTSDNYDLIDEVMVSVFRAPKTFTTEDVVEISFHGSPHIAKKILEVLVKNGARMAKAGEFTMRAFMNGRIDLSQAESIADLIAAENEASRKVALNQLKGGITNEISILRTDLLNFVSLIELELDFAEEDVEFADRTALSALLHIIEEKLKSLIDSFQYGNAVKNGVAVAILGKPNAGKSTLLNALLKEERAIVSDIAGTTRDTIEEVIHIKGNAFRLIDTAGLRETTDEIEKIGVEKAKEKSDKADVLIYLIDAASKDISEDLAILKELLREGLETIICFTKIDDTSEPRTALFDQIRHETGSTSLTSLYISAKKNIHLDELKDLLTQFVDNLKTNESVVITNQRHYEALQNSLQAVHSVEEAVTSRITTELLAYELRKALEYLGEISGEFTNDEVLGNIFSKFCIGK